MPRATFSRSKTRAASKWAPAGPGLTSWVAAPSGTSARWAYSPSSGTADWLPLQPVRFTALYSSDLSRAAQTTTTIGDRLGLHPEFSSELREIFCGRWQGLSVQDVESRYPGQLAEWRDKVDRFTLPGGECVLDVQKRTFAFYHRILERHRGEAIIIVSHGVA